MGLFCCIEFCGLARQGGAGLRSTRRHKQSAKGGVQGDEEFVHGAIL